MNEPRWTVVDIGAGQIKETQDLFQRVFGHPLSEALWRWKYDNGRGVAVGARAPAGELLAHYGGTLRKMFFFGHPALTIQIGDVMVAREGRAALAHKGPFGMVVQAFLKRHIGTVGGPVLGFGFPNARHMRLGERLGHYVQVGKIFELTWQVQKQPTGAGGYRSGARIQAIDWGDSSTPMALDTLWAHMQRDLRESVVSSRDSAWWRHRYANHPEHRYVCFWVRSRWTRRTLGAIVLRPHLSTDAVAGVATVWELMDWLAPLSQTSAMLQAAMNVVSGSGGSSLMGWFSDTVREQFSGTGAAVQEVCTAGVTVPGNEGVFSLHSGFAPSAAALAGKWWLTGGDTDFR